MKLFSRDFRLVVIGQIVSLFGNAVVRFALPLYLLNQTGSSALYGTVTACALIPAVLLSPVGGIVADRVNKRNIMVGLDFFTAAVVAGFSLLMGEGVQIVPLMTATLMLLYGIAGAYQPSVQASIPALVSQERFMEANSVINMISSFASLLGPVLGGIMYSNYGLEPVLWVCTGCFFLSAVMELFIHIPFVKQESGGGIWQTVKGDLLESIRFIRIDKPIIGKAVWLVSGINLFLSSAISVGLPYLVTEVLPFDEMLANRLYGYAAGVLAAGGLAGGICAGIFAKKLPLQKSGRLLMAPALCLFPIAAVLAFSPSGMINYVVLTICCFGIMIFCTIFTVQMMAFFQTVTPPWLIGKVIAVVITVSMCAQPLGNALYGVLFEICAGYELVVLLFAGVVSLTIAVYADRLLACGLAGNDHLFSAK